MARARPMRCCCPPERAAGRRVSHGAEPNGGERLGNPGSGFGGRHLPRLEAEGDILGHGQMREDCIVLKNHADIALVRRNGIEPGSGKADAAGRQVGKAGDGPQQRGLPAAARPQKREELVPLDCERHPVEGAHRAAELLRGILHR